MQTIIINFAVKWRKQVSLDCGSGSSQRLLSNSWIGAPGEMSAGCCFPLLQQLWLPQETRVGLWLVVPQPHGARKRKSLLLSHPGTWLKVLGGQPGSLDQTFVISSRCFQTKQKKIWFSLALRICCVFLEQKENLKGYFFVFPWRLYSWLQTISLVLKPSSAFFPFAPACPFLPTEEAGCVSPSAIPGKLISRWWQISQWGTGTVHSVQHSFPARPVLSMEWWAAPPLRQSSGVSPAVPWVGSKPSGSFFSPFLPQHLLCLSHS